MTKDEVRRELVRGVYGGPGEWRHACMIAAKEGWSEKEIIRILFWYHPATWVWAAIGIAIIVAIILH